jgi:sugar phosphate isomerase/epimerase
MNFAGLSIVLSTHLAKFEAVPFKGDFEANLAKISGWGYQGVELAIRDPGLLDASKLESALARYGLKVPAIGTGQAWVEEHLSFSSPDAQVRNAAVERIKSHLSLASRLNALVIIGLIRGATPRGQSREQSRNFLVECLQKCAVAAAGLHVSLAIEPLNRYETDLIHTVDEGLELIHQVGSQNLGLLLDTFHMNIEESNINESIRKSGSQILHFHVADSNRWYPGAGHLDFKSILHELEAIAYSGWISGEFMPYPEADIAAQRSIEQLKFMMN